MKKLIITILFSLFVVQFSYSQDPIWTISADHTSNWFGTGNTERGLGFNHATGNLIVASRQGGVTPILIDAATGDSVGMLKTIRSAKENPEALWTITAPTSNWFGTGNTERGLGFNPATGNLIVASRQGGVTPILIDAATGDSVGILKNKDVTFSENFEGISGTGDAITGWNFTNTQTYNVGGYGNNSDKYAGWDEETDGDHSIQSPLITNPGVLSFYIAGYSDATNTKVVVETSPDGTTWTTVDILVSKGAGGDFGLSYVKKSYNLNKTGDYYIRWSTTEHVDGGFYLDDIEFHNPISGGTFAFNQIKASADGQIFTANLAINATSKIYRWADENAEPELVYSGDLGGRFGDSFGVIGSADSVHVFLSGSGGARVVAFFWDGTSLTKTADYTVEAWEARGGFSGHAIADSIVITGTGTAPRYMNALDGTLGTQLASADVASADLNSVMVNDQFTYKGKHYVVAGPAFTNGKFYMLDVTDPANATLVHELGPMGENANLNNTGGVVFDDATGRLYIMDTNNAIAAYNMSDFVDMPVISGGIFPFNQIKATSDGQIFTANLAINGESRIYRWADEMAEPELVYAGELGGRLGDSFGVVGEGDEVRVLLSGSGADKVEAFDWNGVELTHAATFPIAAGEARGGFSSHVYEDSVLISGTNTVPRLMNINDGGLGRSLSAMGDRNMTNDILKRGDKSFAVLGPNFGSNYEFRLFDFSDKNNIESINTFNLGQNQNLNNTGGVIFDDINDRLYLMNTNNSIKAFNISDFINNDPAQEFYLHDNGVTIVCTSAEVGESAEINGIKYTKRTKAQIQADHSLASTSCTSGITDMSFLFDAEGEESPSTFNEDISHWDLSSVTTTKNMFHVAKAFNQDVSKWNLSNVTNMDAMFSSAVQFNQDISGWNVSNVTDMTQMFSNANGFNSPLDNWDVSKVTAMHNMFSGAGHFNQPIGSWDVSSVTDMSGMFQGSKFNQDISNWDVSNVTNMSLMFANASNFDQPLNDWDVSSVTNMIEMFNGASSFNQDLSSWCVSLIASEPRDFGNSGTDPIWGTCPEVQGTNNPHWTHDPNFQARRNSIPSVHGVAVDGEGKVWVQSYYATETIVMNRDLGFDGIPDTLSTRAIYIYHPDGTQASFSPLKVINYADGSADTLGLVWYPDGGSYEGYSGRGITADAEGNIIISSYNRLYKVDYTDGSGIAMVDPSAGCSLTEATTDDANNVYVGCVVGSAGPLVKFAPDLTGEEALVTIPGSFSRDLQVSGDGNTIWWAGWTNGSVHRFSRDDEFSSFGDADTVLRGIKAEVFDIHPVTGHLWVGSGSLNDYPADPYEPQRWYAFDVDNLEGSPTPLDTIAWVADPNSSFFGGPGSFDGTYDQARPRALDFSPDGKTAYVGTFAIDNAFQRFTKGEVTVPPPPTDTRKRIDMIVNMKYQELLGNFTNSPEDSVETYVGVYGNFNNWDPTNYAGLAAINDSIYTGEILLDTTMHSELQYRFVIASSTNGIIDIEDNDPVVSSDGQELVNYRWLEVDSSPGLQYSPRVYFSDIGPKEYHLKSLPLLSIEQARAQERGSKVMIEGVVTRVTYNFVYLQDGTAGMLLFSRPWHSDLNSLGFWEAASNGEIQVGDRLKVAGVLDEYQGSQEVVSLAGWKVISKGNELLYTTLDSFDELATNGEAYESQLIRMNNLRFMSTDSTYSYFAYPVMSSNDGSVGYLFMYGANNNPWFGEQFSSKPFSFEGVVRQVLHQGELVYALAPHYREDLKFAGLDNKNMYLGTSYTKEGFKFSNSLSLDNLNTVDSLMSYQFKLKVPKGIRYDSLKLYHSESSPMLVSNFRDSVLSVAVTGSGFITNHHPLIELFFHAEEVGSYTLNLSAVKLNEVHLDEYYPGLVRIDPFMLGDVDDNGEIDAYDAGIVLHQTVGSQILKADPIPSWEQGPWFNWRDGAADVDGDGELLAIDAAQILKYVVGLIDDFTETQPSVESVHIEVTSEGLIISAPEGIEGLNINLPELEGITFSDPDITWENASSVVSKEEGLRIAIASTDVKTGQVLTIPYNMGVDDRQTVQVISYTNGKKMVHEVQLKGINVSNEDDSGLPQEYALSQNYPNPFNPSTKIQYALPKAGDVRIDIYSMLGQKVATLVDTHQPAGYHTATFDASQLSSGVYLYKLTTPGFTQTKKMLLIK